MSPAISARLSAIFLQLFQVQPAEFNEALRPGVVVKWDSLGHIQLIEALQKEFGIKLSITEIMDMDSVQNIVSILESHGIDV